MSANSDTAYATAKEGKTPLRLLSPAFLADISRVLATGEAKHADHHYLDGVDPELIIEAIERHVADLKRGIMTDSESSLHHAAHAAAGLQMLYHTPLGDMRWKLKT